MRTFTVQTNEQTYFNVEVDESLYDKYKDMAVEAMALGLEKFFNGGSASDEAGLSYIIIAYAEDTKGDPNKKIVGSTAHVLRNIGYHDLADECEEQIKKITNKF